MDRDNVFMDGKTHECSDVILTVPNKNKVRFVLSKNNILCKTVV